VKGGALTVNERSEKAVKEEPLPANSSAVSHSGVLLGVKGVEQSAGDEVSGPYCAIERDELIIGLSVR